MPHVLLIEDSEECQLFTKRALAGTEVQLTFAGTLNDAKRILLQNTAASIDLILLDLSLPDGDGMELLEQLHEKKSMRAIPIFLLTSTEEITSKVSAFGMGAEDYLVKPVDPIELRARIEMRLKKSSSKNKSDQMLRKGLLTFDLALLKTFIRTDDGDELLGLTGKEFKILSFLAQNESKAYSRADLVEVIWGGIVHVLDRTVDSHIYGLRKKLKYASHYVECIPHVGYRFVVKPSPNHHSSQTR